MKRIVIISLMFILLLPSLSSFSLNKGNERIYFEPGLEKEILFRIDNSDGPTKILNVIKSTKSSELSGILDEVVHVREPQVTIEAGEKRDLYLDLRLPNELSYGIHNILVMVTTEDPDQRGGQILVKTALGFNIKIYVLYPGKYVEGVFLSPGQVNIGEVVFFRTNVRNIGTEDIENARAKVDIYHDDTVVGSVYSDYMPISSKNTRELGAELLITEGYEIGEYIAKSTIEYDGNTEDARYTQRFNIGELSIGILNITSRKYENNKINKFDIDVESKWNRPSDVYAELILTDFSGNEIDRFKTQTVSVEGWRKTVVPAYMDIKNIENDNYMLKVILHYEGKTSRRTFAVEVSDKGEAEIVEEMPGMPKQTVIIILLSAVIVLLVVVVIMFFLHGRRKYERPRYGKQEEDDKRVGVQKEEGNKKVEESKMVEDNNKVEDIKKEEDEGY